MSQTNPNYGHNKFLSNLLHHTKNHSSSSAHTMSNNTATNGIMEGSRQQPLLQGYLHKIHKRNTKRQKYFVIFDDAPDKPGTGRLEYFDSEKKFRSAMEKNRNGGITNEKRSIILCTCFNINRRCDTKYNNVIGLYRKDDTFSIMAKDDNECNIWLRQMLILQRGKESVDADQPRPTFEHVWEVDIIRRGLGDSYKIFGNYRVCITDTTLSLVRIGPPTLDGVNRPDKVDFALAHMRRCGSTQSVFYLEVGRFTSTGAGEIWMETYDPMIADNMNTIIFNTAQKKANSHRTEENLGPMIRIRSQSANETSRPSATRRQTLTGAKPNFSPSEPDSTESSATSTGTIVMNQNALKPKNNQTHSVSQMSLQSTGIATSAASNNKSHNVDKTSKCSAIQCSYPTLTQASSNKEQQQPTQPSSSQPSTSTSTISISTIAANNGSTGLTRERCDSFPLTTRLRTTSDTTPTHSQIPQQNGNYANNNNNNSMPPPARRPVSMMYTSQQQRYGNSPPNNSSPISPPSCSESDASSASIDEPDGFHPMAMDEHYNSFSIPEENDETHWHKWNNNISLNQRKGSPIQPQHEPYVEMQNYPYSCSPSDPNHTYMPMSPGIEYRTGNYGNSGAHSRASSLVEDNESYVPMHNPSTNHESFLQMSQNPDEYMNMQAGNHVSSQAGDLSSATSSCSITSGTPSTDIRFSEYHLDKVQARFTPSEDDELLDRPPRTYSVGSKLEYTKRKLHIDRVAAEHSSSRHRAYSVGSRNIKVSRAELTSLSGSHTPSSNNSPVAMNHHEINNNNSSASSKNKKSSSAPLLVNVLGNGKTGHGSYDHMDDLMEIDFTSGSSSITRVSTSSTPLKSSPVNIPNKQSDDYMNMSGRQSNKSTSSSTAMSPYVDMRPVSRRVSENNDNDYMDMNPPSSNNTNNSTTTLRTSNTSTSLSSSPRKTSASAPRSVPLSSSNNTNNYMDMSPRSYNRNNNHMTSSATSLSSQKVPSDDYLNMSPVNKSLLEVDLPKRSSVPDGYMEMSWNSKNSKKEATRANGNDNPSSSSDEYINMDYSNNNDGAGTSDSSSSAKDRSISLPINIQKRYSSSRSQKSSIKSGSIENAPPAFLPLASNTASVSPNRSTNINISRSRCDSRDSGIVTPSGSQATIFPFSPGSPMKQFDPLEESNLPRKCLVDGSTGTIKLSEEDIIEEEPRTPIPVGINSEKQQLETLSNDYATMNLGEPVSKKPNLAGTPVQLKSSSTTSANNASSHFLLSPDSEKHDYINCTPIAHISSSKIVNPMPITPMTNNNNNETVGDYALMNPVKCASSPIQRQQQQQQGSDVPPQTSSRKSLLLLSSQEKLNSNSCFKPIVEDSGNHHPILQRNISEKGRQSSGESVYENLTRPSLSRPNSVNSEKIKCSNSGFSSNRPSSANSERLALSSTSSSTSTLCEIQSQCSSSSTLKNIMMDTTSAVPSPMSITSRPESVSSDVHMTSRPPSVTSERELHYASLDLPPCSNTNPIHLAQQQQHYHQQQQKMEVDDSNNKMDPNSSPQTSSSSSSASSQQSQPAFTYAQIDFVKSESLKAQQHQQQQNQSGSKK